MADPLIVNVFGLPNLISLSGSICQESGVTLWAFLQAKYHIGWWDILHILLIYFSKPKIALRYLGTFCFICQALAWKVLLRIPWLSWREWLSSLQSMYYRLWNQLKTQECLVTRLPISHLKIPSVEMVINSWSVLYGGEGGGGFKEDRQVGVVSVWYMG